MEQITEALELGAAIIFFCLALLFGKRVWMGSGALYDALEEEVRQERCVEEGYHE